MPTSTRGVTLIRKKYRVDVGIDPYEKYLIYTKTKIKNYVGITHKERNVF